MIAFLLTFGGVHRSCIRNSGDAQSPVREHDYPVRYVLTESDRYERNKDTEAGLWRNRD